MYVCLCVGLCAGGGTRGAREDVPLDQGAQLQLPHDRLLGQDAQGMCRVPQPSHLSYTVFDSRHQQALLFQFWDTRSAVPIMNMNLSERCYCADVVGSASPDLDERSVAAELTPCCLCRTTRWPWWALRTAASACTRWRASRPSTSAWSRR